MNAAVPASVEQALIKASPCIEVSGLSLRFGALSVIENLDLCIHQHEFVTLLGPSGCGKSSLLRAIAGLIPPAGGSMKLGGQTPGASDLRLGLMFQKPLLLPWRTTMENVLLPVEIERGGSIVSPADRARAEQLLALVQLKGFEDVRPHQLSGGMQQRAALARALMSDPDVLLLDEPFGALDELTRDTLNEELLRIWRSSTSRLKTIVMVTHSIQEAVALSDRIFVLAPRPARLSEIVDVAIPHPRAFDSLAFAQRQAHVRKLIREL